MTASSPNFYSLLNFFKSQQVPPLLLQFLSICRNQKLKPNIRSYANKNDNKNDEKVLMDLTSMFLSRSKVSQALRMYVLNAFSISAATPEDARSWRIRLICSRILSKQAVAERNDNYKRNYHN